ncbi:MAG: metalloenzyme [Roseiflexus sp.]
MSILFLFVDGVGLAPEGQDNPLSDAPTPTIRSLLRGALTIERVSVRSAALLRPLDATMGVMGLPQSGTGQTALLTGVNAAAIHGRHQPYFPPVALRPLLAEHSFFRRLTESGRRVAFANAFGMHYREALATRRLRRSASVIAAEGAGVRLRNDTDLHAGSALTWDITGEMIRAGGGYAPMISARTAGARLASLAVQYDLVFFETFITDLAGHGRLAHLATPEQPRPTTAEQIHMAMERVDGLIAGALDTMRLGDTLLLTGDHGNAESLTAKTHTRNPIPLPVVGRDVSHFEHLVSIVQVADAVVAAAQESLV